MKVEYIDHMGDDLSIVDAARVSFDKQSAYETRQVPTVDNIPLFGPVSYIADHTCLSDKDTKLIHYLAKHGHWSPFSHAYIKFRVTAPIFVARQLGKSTVGLAWNEVSRRYVDDEPTFYLPDEWRGRPVNMKQGSSDQVIDLEPICDMEGPNGAIKTPKEVCDDALETYTTLINMGVAPEQARMILPQSMNTSWIWSGSLYAFSRVVNLRTDSHAQAECQIIANGIKEHLVRWFPVSVEALCNA